MKGWHISMWTESPCDKLVVEWKLFIGQMRQEAETYLLRAQRDRGNGLYFGKIREGRAFPAGFKVEHRDAFAALTPETDRILAFLPRDLSGSELLRLLARRAGRPVCGEEVDLCCLGIKKMEEKTGVAFWTEYEKQIRQLDAVCLRTGHGGLLWACALCLMAYKTRFCEIVE